jgi:hypothetical protein
MVRKPVAPRNDLRDMGAEEFSNFLHMFLIILKKFVQKITGAQRIKELDPIVQAAVAFGRIRDAGRSVSSGLDGPTRVRGREEINYHEWLFGSLAACDSSLACDCGSAVDARGGSVPRQRQRYGGAVRWSLRS